MNKYWLQFWSNIRRISMNRCSFAAKIVDFQKRPKSSKEKNPMKYLRDLFYRMIHPTVKANNLHIINLQRVNPYWLQLTEYEIKNNSHRNFVGGMWDEIGYLQFDFLRKQGLLPEHKFLDIGCGSLRGGVHFIPYLDKGNYYGLDVNSSLIEAGKIELQKINYLDKEPNLLVNEKFEFYKFGVQFNFALALSVFTHLFMNHIGRCLFNVKKVLKPDGILFATFFESPAPIYVSPIRHEPGDIVTNYDTDPFHFSFDEIKWLAKSVGLNVEIVSEWKHPRSQKMLRFKNES